MSAKLPAGTLDRLWSDPKHWRAGLFYSCKEDPRAVVPKKQKWRGWTMNCAHLSAWGFLLFVIVLIAAPVTCVSLRAGVGSPAWFATLAGVIAAVTVLCWLLAHPSRFEEKA
jgi:hypothetical protein